MKLFPEFCKQANARYPREPLEVALFFFQSDRKAAGLGALDVRKREASRLGRHPVRNTKWAYEMTRDVFYRLTIDRLPYTEIDPTQFIELRAFNPNDPTPDCVTLIRHPAVFVERMVVINHKEFWTERGREGIAARLREARRQIRQELAP